MKPLTPPNANFEITGPITYIGVVFDYACGDNDARLGPYDTPEEALEAARSHAENESFRGAEYWAEYNLDLTVPGYGGKVK